MRQVFVQVETWQEAYDRCPWASKIVKVVDGYRAFESISDYEIWINQKNGGEE